MSNGDYRTLVSPTNHKALIFALELTVCFACGIGNFAQYSANAPVAFSRTATFALAGALIISGHMPAHEDRRPGLPNCSISVPISISSMAALNRSTPGNV